MKKYFAVVEAGGTKFNCAVMDQSKNVVAQRRIPTRYPDETMARVLSFFKKEMPAKQKYAGLGIASFGPIDMDQTSPTFGYITKTPKPYWSNTSIAVPLATQLDCPVAFDTDVNGAALAESLWGAGKGHDVVIYVTVGTGIGGGVIINGRPLHGLIHPEIGHMILPGYPLIKGTCPFHENCAEGLASGAAMGKIWHKSAETLDENHQAWDIEATILSQLCHNLLLSFSPKKIIFGGGVMANHSLLEKVIVKVEQSVNEYLTLPNSLSLYDVISPTGLGQNSGLFGAFALAQTQAINI